MAKSQAARKADAEDEISLAFVKAVRPDTAAGAALIKSLPKHVIENLANNLDQTLSQGGGMRWITQEERTLANQLRRIQDINENHRPI